MRLKRILLILFCAVTLQSCAHVRVAQDMQQNRITFDAGNFKEAFHGLLPIAASGNPEAQYAVGYMYYYGYGVSEDSESGMFWMSKAAEQGYMPAIKALHLIEVQKVKVETRHIQPMKLQDDKIIWEHPKSDPLSENDVNVAPVSQKKIADNSILGNSDENPNEQIIPEAPVSRKIAKDEILESLRSQQADLTATEKPIRVDSEDTATAKRVAMNSENISTAKSVEENSEDAFTAKSVAVNAEDNSKAKSLAMNAENKFAARNVAVNSEDALTAKRVTVALEKMSGYTVQLFGSYNVAAVKDLQSQLQLQTASQVCHTTHNGKDWYVLTYKQYASDSAARSAVAQMGGKLHGLNPWVRKLDGLEVV